MLEDESRQRARNPRYVAEKAGYAFVLETRQKIDGWLAVIARVKALRALGRPTDTLGPMLREMMNVRRLLLTELQMQSAAIRTSGPVVSLRRSIDRAISLARELETEP